MTSFHLTAPLARAVLAIFGRGMKPGIRTALAAVVHYGGLKAPVNGIPSLALNRQLITTWVQALDKPKAEIEAYLFNGILSPLIGALTAGWANLDSQTTDGEHKLFSPAQWIEITERVGKAWSAGEIDMDRTWVAKLMSLNTAFGGFGFRVAKDRPQKYLDHKANLDRFADSQGFAFASDFAAAWEDTAAETITDAKGDVIFTPIDVEAVAKNIHIIDVGLFCGHLGTYVRTSSWGHMRVLRPLAYKAWREERDRAQRIKAQRMIQEGTREATREVEQILRENAKVGRDACRMARARV